MKTIILVILIYTFSVPFSFGCDTLLQNFSSECLAQDHWNDIKNNLYSEDNKDPTMVVESRALRFIDRYSWENSVAEGETRPWLIYDPKPKTWSKWEEGFQKSLRLLDDSKITLSELSELHRSALSKNLMTFWSKVKGNLPGKIRSWKTLRAPEFFIKCSWRVSKLSHDLLLDFDLKYPSGNPIMMSKLHLCPDGVSYFGHVLYPRSKYIPLMISNLLKDINRWLGEVDRGELSEGPFTTVAKFQRRFVAIHPFGDGNGRVSRYLQDALLSYINLPSPISADLQNDVITPQHIYNKLFTASVFKHISLLFNCYRNPEKRCQQTYSNTHIKGEDL